MFLFIFILNSFSCLFALSEVKDRRGEVNKEISSENCVILGEVAKNKRELLKDNSILIIGYDAPFIRKGASEKEAVKLAKGVRDYFLYWLKYWNVSLKFLSVEGFELDLKGRQEYLNITIADNEFFQDLQITQKYQALIAKLRDKEGVEVSKDGRNINIDLNLIFDQTTLNIKNSAAYFLDVIVDIVKLSNKNLGLKISVYKNFAYDQGVNDKDILKYLKKVAKVFVDNGEKDSNIYLFPAETLNLKEKAIEIIFFDKALSEAEIADYIDQKEGIAKKKNYKR